MLKFYEWKPEYTEPFLAILTASIGFATYWFISINIKIKNWYFKNYSSEIGQIRYVVFQKVIGFLFMGVIPGFIIVGYSDYSLHALGLNIDNFIESTIYIGIIGLLITTINFFASKNTTSLSIYPQMRVKEWSTKRILINTLSWAAYLFAYEFMFRGLLLIVCVDAFGFWPAVAINLSFYSATHIAKGLTETIGTFPYGLLLCFITISTGSIAVAFVTHLILALTNDFFSIYHNPEMKYV